MEKNKRKQKKHFIAFNVEIYHTLNGTDLS